MLQSARCSAGYRQSPAPQRGAVRADLAAPGDPRVKHAGQRAALIAARMVLAHVAAGPVEPRGSRSTRDRPQFRGVSRNHSGNCAQSDQPQDCAGAENILRSFPHEFPTVARCGLEVSGRTRHRPPSALLRLWAGKPGIIPGVSRVNLPPTRADRLRRAQCPSTRSCR